MRLLTYLLALLVIIIGLSFWTNYSLQASTRDLTRQIDILMADIQKGDWEQAVKQANIIENSWDKAARWWPIILDHQEIDNIEFSLSKTKEYISSQNAPLSRGQLSELRLMIKHIPEKEALNLQNIF
jgi:hypothetical protein